jgi:two-component system, LytTR family, sensor kinase
MAKSIIALADYFIPTAIRQRPQRRILRTMKKAVIHILFWVVFFFVWQQLVYFYIDNPANRMLFTAFDVGLIALSFYLIFYWTTPRFFHRKNKLPFTVAFVLAVLVSAGLLTWVMQFFLHKAVVPIHFNILWEYRLMVRNRFFIAVLGAVAGFTAQLAAGWVESRKRIAQAEQERVAAELLYLRAQINPHFLFNSINTIYVQMDLSKEAARETLAIFSDMLRYQLYECNGESVSLEKEFSYIRNYVYLQKLRKDEGYTIEFVFEGSMSGEQIAPFLLLPFIENMFKHVGPAPAHIRGSFRVEPGRLEFRGTNTRTATGSLEGGIGLTNVKRRLALLYPERYSLDIQDQPSTYNVCLSIQLR